MKTSATAATLKMGVCYTSATTSATAATQGSTNAASNFNTSASRLIASPTGLPTERRPKLPHCRKRFVFTERRD